MTDPIQIAQFDQEAARAFLRCLDPVTKRFTFQTFTDSREAKEKIKCDPIKRVTHGSLDELWPKLQRLSADGAGIFVVINETDFRGRAGTNIVRVRAYFVDLDGAQLSNLLRLGLRPHFVTQTSPGRYHAYWLVEDAASESFRPTQQRLAKLCEGDLTVCDLPRVMRLPGFPHQKNPSQPFLVKMAPVELGPPHRDADFQVALGVAEANHSACTTNRTRSIAPELASRPASPPDMRQGYPDGHRTLELTRRAGWCLGPENMDEGEAAAACLAWNRHNTPPLPEDKIRSTVESIAKAEAKKRAASLQLRGDDLAAVLTKVADQSFQNGDDAEIARLAQLRPLVYERERKEGAKRLGCRESILDKLISAARGEADDAQRQGRPLDLHEPDPWPEPVDGHALLSEISATFSRYVVMSRAAADGAALWVLHAYLIEAADATPRLAIKSPEKRCGKTRLLSIIAQLVPRGLATSNISPAALFRTIEAAKPTLLIDEADTFVTMSDELRNVINSGHTRPTAYVVRTEGEDLQPRRFSTWAPMAFAAIGKLPGTVEDRSITIPLRRRRPDERVERFQRNDLTYLQAIASAAARFAADHAAKIVEFDPEIPDQLHDRAADNWRPLLVIAETAGGDWPGRARTTAIILSADGAADQDSMRTLLLRDIRSAFQFAGSDRLSSDDTVAYLVSLDERPWSELNKGRPITKAGLARLLKPFRISSTTLRPDEGARPSKGYYLSAFQDAFDRYLELQSVTALQTP
jgi:Protein of unknown function (DUF3631)/RepB DNA-primase from phage plasmid